MLIDLDAEDVRTIRIFLPMAKANYRSDGSVHKEIAKVLKKLPDVETRIGYPAVFLGNVQEDWKPTGWWRAVGPDGQLWFETSTESDIHEHAKRAPYLVTIQKLVRRVEEKWINA